MNVTDSVRGRGDPLLRTMWLWAQFDDRVVTVGSDQSLNKFDEVHEVTRQDLHDNAAGLRDAMTEHLIQAGINRDRAHQMSEHRILEEMGLFGLDEIDGSMSMKRPWALKILNELDDRLIVTDEVIRV